LSKSLAVLTTARKKNPATPGLWLAAIRAELRHGNKKEADALLAKALQECPTVVFFGLHLLRWCHSPSIKEEFGCY